MHENIFLHLHVLILCPDVKIVDQNKKYLRCITINFCSVMDYFLLPLILYFMNLESNLYSVAYSIACIYY